MRNVSHTIKTIKSKTIKNMESKITCLHDRHVALGAHMEPFGGFDMPIQYTTISEEHNAVRNKCGVFDVSHMGEVIVRGKDAEKFVDHIFTNEVKGAAAGDIFYGMMLYPDGGTVDDFLTYKMGENDFFLVVNAANTDKDFAYMQENAKGFDIDLRNVSDDYGQLAVQGPDSENILREVMDIDCATLGFYKSMVIEKDGKQVIVSRTGYTGEDGFEIYGTHEYIVNSWDALMKAGVTPCGLGCRDTLRFEVGLPLYGHELSEKISPVMAGLSMFCNLDKEFIGKDAIAKQKEEKPEARIVGIELEGKAIPRAGYEVLHDGEVVGHVTTGYRCISTDKSVCMALVKKGHGKLETQLEVQIRKKTFPGVVVKKKFYDKHYKK